MGNSAVDEEARQMVGCCTSKASFATGLEEISMGIHRMSRAPF